MQYSLPYVAFMFFLFILMLFELNYIKNEKDTKPIIYVALASMVLFFGLKGAVGCDTFMYYQHFKSLNGLGSNFYVDGREQERFEIGYQLYIYIFKLLGFNYWTFQVVNVLIDACLLYVIIRRDSPFFVMSLILYLAFGGFFLEAETLRIAKGTLLFLLSLKYAFERRLVCYVILNVIGVLFHTSSLLYLLLYPFIVCKFNKFAYTSIFILCMVVFFGKIRFIEWIVSYMYIYGNDSIANRIDTYMTNGFFAVSQYTIGAFNVISIFIYLAVCVFSDRFEHKYDNHVVINVFVLAFMSTFCLCEVEVLRNRVSQLFLVSLALVVPNLSVSVKSPLMKQLVAIVFAGLYSVTRVAACTKSEVYRYETSFGVTDYKMESLMSLNNKTKRLLSSNVRDMSIDKLIEENTKLNIIRKKRKMIKSK